MAENHPIALPADLAATLENFRNWLIARKGLALNTVANHVGFIRRHAAALGADPTADDVDRFIVQLRTSGCSYSHTVNTLAAIERYMEFRGRPVELKWPRKPQTLLKASLSEAEIARIIAGCRSFRDKAIIALLSYSGIRNAELCRLHVRDVDLANGLVNVRCGKNQKDYKAYIAGCCAELLTEYVRQAAPAPEDLLFRTARRHNEFEPQDLRKLVRCAARRVGIEKRVHPHLFRHSLAMNMLLRGAHLLTIKEQLGHAFIDTTMLYLRSANPRARMEYQLCAPSYL